MITPFAALAFRALLGDELVKAFIHFTGVLSRTQHWALASHRTRCK